MAFGSDVCKVIYLRGGGKAESGGEGRGGGGGYRFSWVGRLQHECDIQEIPYPAPTPLPQKNKIPLGVPGITLKKLAAFLGWDKLHLKNENRVPGVASIAQPSGERPARLALVCHVREQAADSL